MRRRVTRRATVSITVDESFHERLEAARRKFMEKQGMNKLTTTNFTGILSNLNPNFAQIKIRKGRKK